VGVEGGVGEAVYFRVVHRDEDREWTYFKTVMAPNSGNFESLEIHFRAGVVVGVTSGSLNSIIQD